MYYVLYKVYAYIKMAIKYIDLHIIIYIYISVFNKNNIINSTFKEFPIIFNYRKN